ncbi:hypothetical protein DAPPUDRAFT_230011 [Daphnia pulex]|uniref:Uncharacterized protein n=1 Tax=Daphnia pulex TaxID=6669 RepID=E9I271_DAPPU|nr:hypothetical protein DAPPUDRAFT_230011 [Daphnia pulex]|eukprot:EFX61908.1 hypothetical protein DAPPUDRAFT_230011 [Daphnia pulex]
MKISAFVVVLLAIASVAGDTQRSQQRPNTYPSIRIYHPEYKIPIARPYSTIKRESPASPPVVMTPSRKFQEVKEEEEEVREEVAKPVIKRQARPSVTIKTEPKESPKTNKQEVAKTNSKKVEEEVNKVNREVKAVYTRRNPSPPPARAIELPAKYSAQYKTGPPAPSRARSVEPFLPAESLPTPERLVATPERLVATTESPSAPDESLLSIISEKLPNPEKFNAPPRARIVEFPNLAVEARPAAPEQFSPIDVDFNDVFELDGPLPIPAAFRNRRRVANPRIVTRRIVNPSRRREAERWW